MRAIKTKEKHIKAQLAAGDEKAFQQLFEGYWEHIYGFCFHYARDEEQAKDLTQTVFTYIWEQRNKLWQVNDLEHYLAGIARFQCFHYIRQRTVRDQKLESIQLAQSNHAKSTFDPHRLLEYKQFADLAENAIDNLPEPGKSIFMMSRHAELSYQEIALQRGISVKTVQYHISAMLRILREKIK